MIFTAIFKFYVLLPQTDMNILCFLSRDIVELLLSYEASCNSADDKGSSPLHLASWAGFKEIVEMLLTKGPSIANVNLTVSLTTNVN